MDVIWERYIGRKRFCNKTAEPIVRINSRGSIFFNNCEHLISNLPSYNYIDILVGRNVNDEIVKIGFRFSNVKNSNSVKRLIHQKNVHYFSHRPFVHEFFPRIMIDSEITSLQFSPTVETSDTLSILLELKSKIWD